MSLQLPLNSSTPKALVTSPPSQPHTPKPTEQDFYGLDGLWDRRFSVPCLIFSDDVTLKTENIPVMYNDLREGATLWDLLLKPSICLEQIQARGTTIKALIDLEESASLTSRKNTIYGISDGDKLLRTSISEDYYGYQEPAIDVYRRYYGIPATELDELGRKMFQQAKPLVEEGLTMIEAGKVALAECSEFLLHSNRPELIAIAKNLTRLSEQSTVITRDKILNLDGNTNPFEMAEAMSSVRSISLIFGALVEESHFCSKFGLTQCDGPAFFPL